MKLFNRCYGFLIVAILAPTLLAAEPPLIKPAASLPNTTPWNLKSLSVAPEFEWTEAKGVRSLHYKSVPFKGRETRVFAYYATPGTLANDTSTDKNLPGIVLLHGGGGKAFKQWAELWAKRGYAAIAMTLGGGKGGGPNQKDSTKFGEINQPLTDQWTYHAVVNSILAHSLILSFPEVDKEKTALTGISWGGYLTCIVAGLDNRFKAAAPVYGCGFLHENSHWVKANFAKMSPEDTAKWVKLWDPSMYAGSASMPMLFANGGKDFAYPPDSHAKTYGLVKSPKNLHFVPDFRHGHFFGRPKALEVFMNHHLKGGVSLADIGETKEIDGKVTAPVVSKAELIRAQLHYTLDALPGNSKSRKWVSVKAEIKDNQIIAKLPSAKTTIYFLTVTDQRNATVSSDLVFAKKK